MIVEKYDKIDCLPKNYHYYCERVMEELEFQYIMIDYFNKDILLYSVELFNELYKAFVKIVQDDKDKEDSESNSGIFFFNVSVFFFWIVNIFLLSLNINYDN